jgi:HK97 family phage major capsid protein
MKSIEELREARAALLEEVMAIRDAATAETRDISEEETKTSGEKLDEVEKLDVMIADEERVNRHLKPVMEQRQAAPAEEAEARHARPKDPESEEKTYRPDMLPGSGVKEERGFLRDLFAVKSGDRAASDRLERNRREAMEFHGPNLPAEYRDMANASTTGGDFVPPLYLGDLWTEPVQGGRPLADSLPHLPLPSTGTAITIPAWSSGASVAARADAGAVSETDGVTATVTHDVNEVAGMLDIGRILIMRSDPSFEIVAGRQLRRQYDTYLDTQLIGGSGTAPQHRGIRNVSGVNTVAYTDASPTAAELWPKVFDAIQKIESNRDSSADLIVMAPRRASWVASQLSSTFPLLQLASLNQAGGQQDKGFAYDIAGLDVLKDKNVGILYGAGTNEDEIYVLASEDFYLMEGPLMARVHDDVGSGTGVIRFAVFAFSAFLSKRYPKGVTVISGTGLVTPTF